MTGNPEPKSDATARPPPVLGEMRHATVMMLDMVGSTETTERLGPEASSQLLAELLKMARAAVVDHGGVVMNEMGDGLLALFGAPVSVERASLAACRAGTAVFEAVGGQAESLSSRFGVAPQLRIGLAEGEVLVTGHLGEGSFNATGSAVNLAARLQSLAEPNTLICSGPVAAATLGWVRFDPKGSYRLRGFSEPIETFTLSGLENSSKDHLIGSMRFAGDFVGRNEEMTRLLRWHAGEIGDRPVSLIVGEAGIGKSRLAGELAARLGDKRVLVGSCQPTTTARPLAPLVEILRGYAGWHHRLPVDDLAATLAPVLASTDVETSDALVRLVAGQAEDETEENPSRAIDLRKALAQALSAVARSPECLVVIEDLHWIDPLSGDVLLSVIADAPASLRMLGTTRPVSWLHQLPWPRIENIDAGPISASDVGNIARAVMGEAADEAFVNQVAKSSEGNPFFAIEILHNIAAGGDGADAGRIGSIQNIALARFDRLDHGSKRLLRMAAVLGRSFRRDVLKAAAAATDEEVAALANAAEGIVEPDPADPDASCWFQHILFRDSIYATIPPATRKAMHLAAAQAVDACNEDGSAGAADVLADHYECADEPVHAVRFLCEAARGALGLYALESCKLLMDRAFRLIEADHDRFGQEALEAAVLLRMRCLDVLDLHRQTAAFSEVWLPRLRTGEGSPAQAMILTLTAKAHCQMADLELSQTMVEQALEMAERHGAARAIAYAKVVLMRVLGDSGIGSIEQVERLFEETRAFTESHGDEVLYVIRMWHMISAYQSVGQFGRALEVTEEIQAFGARHNQPHVILAGDWNRSLIGVLTNDFETGLIFAEAAIAHSQHNTAYGEIARNLKLASQLGLGLGEDFEIADIERIRIQADLRGELITRNGAMSQMALTHFFKGKVARGWKLLRACKLVIDVTGTVTTRRFFLLHQAELLLTVAGLIKASGPTPKLGPADIAVALYLRLIARRRAKGLLTRLLAELHRQEGLFAARAHTCLALIVASEGRTDAAIESFDLAERLFKAEGLTSESNRLSELRAAAGL